jgi:acyl carrier protein
MSDIAERVKKIVVDHLSVEEAKVTETASFIDDLGESPSSVEGQRCRPRGARAS